MALVLAIVGLLATAVFKGYGLLQKARLQKTADEIRAVKTAALLFRETYNNWPGNFENASAIWKGTRNGRGDGLIHGDNWQAWSEASLFWQHLSLSGLWQSGGLLQKSSAQQGIFLPKTSLGAVLSIQKDPNEEMSGVWLLLSSRERGQAALTPAQAQTLDRILDCGDPEQGSVRGQDAPGVRSGSCVREGRYNLGNKKAACFLYIRLEDN